MAEDRRMIGADVAAQVMAREGRVRCKPHRFSPAFAAGGHFPASSLAAILPATAESSANPGAPRSLQRPRWWSRSARAGTSPEPRTGTRPNPRPNPRPRVWTFKPISPAATGVHGIVCARLPAPHVVVVRVVEHRQLSTEWRRAKRLMPGRDKARSNTTFDTNWPSPTPTNRSEIEVERTVGKAGRLEPEIGSERDEGGQMTGGEGRLAGFSGSSR